MAANSSTYASIWMYDVFLSFRGEDTRYTFVSHLYEALNNREGIITFKDDKDLERGRSITPSLVEAIENSKVALVVLSQNYAFSPWCLDELVEIVRCKDTKGQVVLPIFYGVDPSDVEMQTKILTKAFEEHELNFNKEKVQKWKDALSIVATTSGWDAKNFDGCEATLIKHIVRNVSDQLACIGLCFEDELVGINSHMVKIAKLLEFDCNDVQMVGIWGIGGIGKTTIVDFLYYRDARKFEVCCRLKNVKEKHKKDGLVVLQKELISQIFPKNKVRIWDEDLGCNVIRKRLQNKKVLLVLDDIDDLDQLKVLANRTCWFGRGSRIIITTRDERLLILHGVQHIYNVPLMMDGQDLQLFSLHAFRKNQPTNDFLKLSKQFVSYAHRLPLVLKVLGAHLYNRDKVFWCNELEKLKVIPNAKIHRVMKISFDGLDDLVKRVFLDIAFFFNRWSVVSTKRILYRCGFYSENAITILKEKALLTIENDRVWMHEIIQAMGHKIVKEESKDNPNKRSRLRDPNDIYAVLTNGKKTKIEGISLDMSKISPVYLKSDTFKRMDRLKILDFYTSFSTQNTRSIYFDEGLDCLPNPLTYINWDYFPFKSLPSSFCAENLVELKLTRSGIEHLWMGHVELVNLRCIDFSGSECLKTIPNLSKAMKIEEIYLIGCENFIGFSHDFRYHERLVGLYLDGCKKLEECPSKLPSSLKELFLSGTAIKELPSEIESLTNLNHLRLKNCTMLSALPIQIRALKSLKNLTYLTMSGCEKLSFLPIEIGAIESLMFLEIGGSLIRELPPSIGELKSLIDLTLEGVSIVELPESIGYLHNLDELTLVRCRNLVRLPNSLHQLSCLHCIKIKDCKSFCSRLELPPSVENLVVGNSDSWESLRWKNLKDLQVTVIVNRIRLGQENLWEVLKHGEMGMFYDINRRELLSLQKQLSCRSWNRNCCVVPGNEIPEGCQYRSCESSSSITLKFPSSSRQLEWIALFVVFGPSYQNPQDFLGSISFTCEIYDDADNLLSTRWVPLDEVRVDHVMHFYDGEVHETCECHLIQHPGGCDIRIHFHLEDTSMVIKKCGVRVIYSEEAVGSASIEDCTAGSSFGISASNEECAGSSSYLHNQSNEDKVLLESHDEEQCSKRMEITHTIE